MDLVLGHPMVSLIRSWQRAGVDKSLRKYGLRYTDCLIESNPDFATAVSRLPAPALQARNRRIFRALDMSCKHKYLPEDLQALQTPWEDDGLIALVHEARALREEKEAMQATDGSYFRWFEVRG